MMRQKMLDGHPNRSPLFDLKHDRGGMVDIEFVVQYLVLANAHQCPILVKDLGNIALLELAAQHQLIPRDLSLACQDAYRVYRTQQHRLRLNEQEFARVSPNLFVAEKAKVLELWSWLLN
jgi:[glutamine synthetase] adenylyltransferase / [glutamine synthetase]-adenylyl-L-tyrosine phosphorylase